MNPETEIIARQLNDIYSRTNGSIAFVDESYKQFADEYGASFYLVTASILTSKCLINSRSALIKVAGGHWWHTTEIFRQGKIHQIGPMIGVITENFEVSCLSVQEPVVAGDLETARRKCLVNLYAHLDRRMCKTVVIERRPRNSERNSDASLVKRAISQGLLSKQLLVFQGHPGAEPLLWAPDVICWALRRSLALGDSYWISQFDGAAELIVPTKYLGSKQKEPQRSAESGCGPGLPIVRKEEVAARSSAPILPFTDLHKQVLNSANIRAIPSALDTDFVAEWLAAYFPKP